MGYNSTGYLAILDELADNHSDIPDEIINSLMGYIKSIYRSDMSDKYSTPMKYIGMYIALASLVCILAMVADLLHGLRSRKLWFPCKYFKINAAFLTIIGVAMKLPVDLSGSMPGEVDQVAKLGSVAFMCTMMANLLPGLATMDRDQLVSNFTALSILVITLAVNVCIQIATGVVSLPEDVQRRHSMAPNYGKLLGLNQNRNKILAAVYVVLLLDLLMLHVSSCLAILRSKKIIESKYQKVHNTPSTDIDQSGDDGELLAPFEKLQDHVINHWIMAGSGSPQFIAACFRTTSASGVISLLVAILHTATMFWPEHSIVNAIRKNEWDSDYSWSMIVIVIVQFLGVLTGTIAPLSRCFATLSFKVSTKIISNHFRVFEVESYWTHKLHEWKRASTKLPFSTSNHFLKVVIERSKELILSLCIELQEGVVGLCNIVALIPFVFMIGIYFCVYKLLFKTVFRSSCSSRSSNETTENKDLELYVLHLEDGMDLANRTLEGLLKSVKRLIRKGQHSEPKNLIELISKEPIDRLVYAVQKFDRINDQHVPTLQTKLEKIQDCWSLPVVTLTSIAISVGETDEAVKSLLKSVRQGLKYVTIVEESLNVSDEYLAIRTEVETLWKEVDVKKKWLGHKLRSIPSPQVEWLRDKSKEIIRRESSNGSCTDDDSIHRSNSIHWFICANSMYRVTKTILLRDNIGVVSRKELFDDLSSMIGGIIAACLTNIPQVIIRKCDTSVIEQREASVEDAARLLGQTKVIMEKLREPARHVPCMKLSDLPFIDKWRGYTESEIP